MFGKLVDKNTLVIPAESTAQEEFPHLFGLVGFRLTPIVLTNAELRVIEGVKVQRVITIAAPPHRR